MLELLGATTLMCLFLSFILLRTKSIVIKYIVLFFSIFLTKYSYDFILFSPIEISLKDFFLDNIIVNVLIGFIGVLAIYGTHLLFDKKIDIET